MTMKLRRVVCGQFLLLGVIAALVQPVSVKAQGIPISREVVIPQSVATVSLEIWKKYGDPAKGEYIPWTGQLPGNLFPVPAGASDLIVGVNISISSTRIKLLEVGDRQGREEEFRVADIRELWVCVGGSHYFPAYNLSDIPTLRYEGWKAFLPLGQMRSGMKQISLVASFKSSEKERFRLLVWTVGGSKKSTGYVGLTVPLICGEAPRAWNQPGYMTPPRVRGWQMAKIMEIMQGDGRYGDVAGGILALWDNSDDLEVPRQEVPQVQPGSILGGQAPSRGSRGSPAQPAPEIDTMSKPADPGASNDMTGGNTRLGLMRLNPSYLRGFFQSNGTMIPAPVGVMDTMVRPPRAASPPLPYRVTWKEDGVVRIQALQVLELTFNLASGREIDGGPVHKLELKKGAARFFQAEDVASVRLRSLEGNVFQMTLFAQELRRLADQNRGQ